MIIKKKIINTIAIVVLSLGLALGAYAINNDKPVLNTAGNVDVSDLPIYPMRSSFVINVDNPNAKVEFFDYVFVGKVVKNHGTVYSERMTMVAENAGTKDISAPYTIYEIEVIDNIKGNLNKNTPIEFRKAGGISADKKAVYVFENDELPAENKYYIFSGSAGNDGSIIISGPNSNIPLNASDKQDILSSKQYKEYKNAFENQVKVQRERSVSKFRE
ncbi:hypothetical protein [Desulfosporosinus sp. HMP52]|uniref:hypothetical protein n=1 Tax=Desulfosporosinus sp. HMP52 TaxID=1487923 RepID=UPI00068AAC67|nr:hypothetical protein [Desulfosporosinus sp. HMP52]